MRAWTVDADDIRVAEDFDESDDDELEGDEEVDLARLAKDMDTVRRRGARNGVPALRKLEYMDELMRALRRRPPPLLNTSEVDPLRKLRKTLRQHYRAKRRHYGVDYPDFYDRDLRRIFSDADAYAGNATAAQFISRNRRAVRRVVANWTGIYQYTIDQVLEDMMARCRELKLRLTGPDDLARQEFTVLVTVQAMNYLHSGGHRLFL